MGQISSSVTDDVMTTARKAKKPGVNERFLAFLHLAPGMSGFIIFVVIPLIASIVISLYRWPLFGDPKFIGQPGQRRQIRPQRQHRGIAVELGGQPYRPDVDRPAARC